MIRDPVVMNNLESMIRQKIAQRVPGKEADMRRIRMEERVHVKNSDRGHFQETHFIRRDQ